MRVKTENTKFSESKLHLTAALLPPAIASPGLDTQRRASDFSPTTHHKEVRCCTLSGIGSGLHQKEPVATPRIPHLSDHAPQPREKEKSSGSAYKREGRCASSFYEVQGTAALAARSAAFNW